MFGSLLSLVDDLTKVAKSSSITAPAVQPFVYKIAQRAERAKKQDLDIALQRMSLLVAQTELMPAAYIALGCGVIIEQGGDPEIVYSAIIQRIREALKLAPLFGAACQNKARRNPDTCDPEDIEACVKAYGESLLENMYAEAQAWFVVKPMCTAALAVLMRLPLARNVLCQDTEFLTMIEMYPDQNASIVCLREVLQVLDNEEILVLHPALKCGYRICIRGVGDNFQLHTLLADALIGNPDQGWLPGKRPDSRIAAAAKDGSLRHVDRLPAAEGAFNLWNWQGLQPDGTLPEGYRKNEHWIWNEGKPVDITRFEGIRTILLSPPPYPRTWNAGRYFPGMKGELAVLEVLSTTQVNDWLRRIMAAVVQLEAE
jgi:hypothetical protein